MKLRFLLAPLFTLAIAFAQPPAGGPNGPGGPGAPRVSALQSYLGLTDTQVTAIRQAQRQAREAQRPLFEKMRTKHQELRTLLAAPNSDAAAIGTLTKELEALRSQLKQGGEGIHAAAVNLLSPDQRTKLQALEAAANLRREIGEAHALHLLTPPEGGHEAGMGAGPGHGPRMGRGKGPMGGAFRR